MLAALGFATIAIFLVLVMTKRVSVLVALVAVPATTAVLGGFSGELGGFMQAGLLKVAPVAIMITFAILYFTLLTEAGMFDPVIRRVIGWSKGDPVKIAIGTAVLTLCVALDGDGASTFLIVVSAMLPLYKRLGMSPLVLSGCVALAAGVMNMIPWGGPTARAMASLKLGSGDIFTPMIPAMLAGIAWVLFASYILGRKERDRLAAAGLTLAVGAPPTALVADPVGVVQQARPRRASGAPAPLLDELEPSAVPVSRATPKPAATGGANGSKATSKAGAAKGSKARSQAGAAKGSKPTPKAGAVSRTRRNLADDTGSVAVSLPEVAVVKQWFNVLLTVALLVGLVQEVMPLPVLFLLAYIIALLANAPTWEAQQAQLERHGGSVALVTTMIFAAGVFTGILGGTKMITEMASSFASIIPDFAGPLLAPVLALVSMPLSLVFTPDAFYFGVLPVFGETAASLGIDPALMGRAAILGQMTTGFPLSPLTASTFILIGMSGVELQAHARHIFKWAFGTTAVMTAVGLLTGALL